MLKISGTEKEQVLNTYFKIECMNTNNHLGFITGKIEELGTAVLHSHSNSVLNIKSTVVNTRQVDENGNIWFTISKPRQEINQFEKQFPVALNYYKKGTAFFLNIFGIARIVSDPEEVVCAKINNELEVADNEVLMSVKILNANYYEKDPEKTMSWLSKCKNALLSLFAFDEDSSYYWTLRTENDRHFA